MGIYDREYYRRDGPGFLGSFTDRGLVCKWLILANVVTFVIQLITQQRVPAAFGREVLVPGSFTDALLLNADLVLRGEVWRLLTYAFLHDVSSPMHILFNMLFLWWFGSDVEDVYGPREFLAIYLVSALAGGVAFTLASVANLGGNLCLGASGAVTAVMVLCAVHYPTRVILLFFILPVPIWLFVVFQVAQDTFLFLGQVNTRTAVTVHLAGAAFAFAYYKLHWRLLNLWPDFSGWRQTRSRPRLRVYREEEEEVPAAVPVVPELPEVDEHLEAKLDAVLEKVARSGQASLTESERQILVRASEVYRKRRS